MYADYERLVLEDYQRKKSHNILSYQLIHPTPARIKRECVRLCGDKLLSKDEKVIRDFCEEWNNDKTYLQNIDNCDIDKFRPLLKFLKRGTTSTDPKNIHLLAWLIDFPERPFVYGKKYEPLGTIDRGVNAPDANKSNNVKTDFLHDEPYAADIEMENGNIEIQEDDNGSNEIKGNDESIKYSESLRGSEVTVRDNQLLVRQKKKFHKVVIIGILLAVTGGGYWLWDYVRVKDETLGNGSCMYWAGDHFQPIPCYQKMPNTLVVALDSVRVKNFKKITRPDTITYHAMGHVWYSKINMKIEFFTADGEHPVVIGRRLKPITDYIIDKYIRPEMGLNQ